MLVILKHNINNDMYISFTNYIPVKVINQYKVESKCNN